MQSSRQVTRGLRAIGVSAGALVFAAAAILSGCYYRGRSPERGGRGYGYHDRDHSHAHDHDHDHDRH